MEFQLSTYIAIAISLSAILVSIWAIISAKSANAKANLLDSERVPERLRKLEFTRLPIEQAVIQNPAAPPSPPKELRIVETTLPFVEASPRPIFTFNSDQATAAIVAEYNQLAATPSFEARDAFIKKFDVEQADFSPRLLESAEQLWWVPLPEHDNEGLMFPGWKAIRDWSKSYRGSAGAQVRAQLEGTYTSEEGNSLIVIMPATGRLHFDGRIELRMRGRLSGA